MKNIIKYLLLSFISSVVLINAQQMPVVDSLPVYLTEGSAMATSTVDGNQLLKRSSLNPANTLYGHLNGLTVLQSPGYGSIGEANPTMFIRGIGTINNERNILVMVDGIERPLSSLVTEEIESVTVFKDAVALALYGMRGANGVLMVTTKRGKQGKAEMNVSYQHSFTTPTRLPKFANAAAYVDAVNEGLINEGLAPRYSNPEKDAYRSQQYPFLFPDVNWMDETLRQWGSRDQVNISSRGGSDISRYFSLINIISDRGLINEASFDPDYSGQLSSLSANIRTNLDINLTPTTLMQTNLLAQISESNRPGALTDASLMTALYTLPSNAYPVRNYDDSWGGGSSIYPMNPVANSSSTGYAVSHSRGIYADFLLKQDLDMIVEGLNIEGKIGFDAYSSGLDVRSKQFLARSVVSRLNESGFPADTIVTEYGRDDKELGFSKGTTGQQRNFDLQFRLNYQQQIGAGHLAAFLQFRQDKKVLVGINQTYMHQEITAFGQYSLNDKYYFDLSLSEAGSNRLPKHNHWGFLPAAGVAWRVSREAFLENASWLDDLKLRLSFGLAGNDRITYDLDKHMFGSRYGYLFREYISQGGWSETRLPSQKVTFEKTQMLNFGIESQLFKKVTLNVDMFYNKTYDIMVSQQGAISTMFGAYTYPFVPDGEVSNRGVEVGLGINDQAGDFKYSFGGQFSFVRNKIVNQNEAYQPYAYRNRTGRPVGQLFGMENIGFFRDQADIDQSPLQMFTTVYPGDFKYKDQNGDGQIDINDEVPIGYSSLCPEIYYSATLDLEYKGFGVNALLQGVGNYSVYLNTTSLYFPLTGNVTISEHYLESYWRPGADNTGAKYPRLTTTASANNYRSNTTFIADASYLKLRSAEAYYKLPASLISKIKVSDCKIFLRGMDLFSFDLIKVIDPEARGVAYPALKSYHVGLSINF